MELIQDSLKYQFLGCRRLVRYLGAHLNIINTYREPEQKDNVILVSKMFCILNDCSLFPLLTVHWILI
jgi:hypothetical protein